MDYHIYQGAPGEIGRQHGRALAEAIRRNLSILVWREGYEPLPLRDPAFVKWVADQEAVIAANWPWLIEEMHGVADGSDFEYRDILLLNLRVWQYGYYSGNPAPPAIACSSLILTLADGSTASSGALDDGSEYYRGMVTIVPNRGYSFMTFPIVGTSWGNRGLNSAGLCVGASSQILNGLKRLPGAICADIANRVILQTCATVAEVREFCKRHPFTLNLACSDRNGDVFCAHQTSAGLFEVAAATPCVLTNHVVDDQLMARLSSLGASGFPENGTSRLRRGRLLDFASRQAGKCSGEDVRRFVADRMSSHPASACPSGNIVLTYAAPQAEPGTFWVADPQSSGDETWTKYVFSGATEPARQELH